MIDVRNLSKWYGSTRALNTIGFDVAEAETVGFLGPNGAGKTTTMRILAAFLVPSGGMVTIDGLDVVEHSMDVRRRVGYLQENVPLYPDMRVREYLRFRARLKGLSARRAKARVEAVSALCGLEGEESRMVRHLSKGYRKRVGLADTLVHEPRILVLDEPTLGLDPNQVRRIRALIRTLARDHTIVLSTDNLREAERLCDRILIIDAGRVVAFDTPKNLALRVETGPRVIADIGGDPQAVLSQLEEIAEIVQISWEANGDWARFVLDCRKDSDVRTALFRMGVRNGWTLRELRMESTPLEDVFLAFTEGRGAGHTEGEQDLRGRVSAETGGGS